MTLTATRTVLVLHGYSQNATMFSKRLGALRKQCGKDIEFVFCDGPVVLYPADLTGFASPTPENTDPAADVYADPALTPRGWWKTNSNKTQTTGLDSSLLLLRDILKSRKFDGVFGFSQGAALAALLAALLERPHVYPEFLTDGQPPHPPFQFCVAVAGFRISSNPLVDIIYGDSYSTPTLHVVGRTDIIVTPERAQKLVDLSSDKRVEEHDGGHFVPSKANWRKFLKDYLTDPFADLPRPRANGIASGPASGTATPTESKTASL
ncbi:FSH1-domain-containing protein [Mycena floridula]|nr:FSH1-domain-containing protein [Mycena floridula]